MIARQRLRPATQATCLQHAGSINTGATAMKRVSLFTMANCPHCKTAKQYLEQQKIGFRLVDVRSPAGQKEFAKTGFRSVPVLKIGDQYLKGFSVKGFNQLYKG
ncbi:MULTISPECIES: glutaredoxin family protein [Cobetia]|uniref:glutaredoxin family protein n=1 Tax=Cobetia TaxID=204286 RepID=UPI001C2E8B3B|nr:MULTISPECIES: glutaredoxin family protein [Cobetia]MDI4660979.1 glutaredoxin family protein [Cobetia sp. BMC6]MDL2191032.1 glutaredoxin family protein [Cobetia sp. LC6]